MKARDYPPPFVGPRTEPPRVLYRAELPLCVRVSRERGEDLEHHAQFWHDVQERENLGGCQRCVYLAAAPHRLPAGVPLDSGTYADDAGRALVARGVWDPEQILTARTIAVLTARRFLGGGR